jgi:hypothetical protein
MKGSGENETATPPKKGNPHLWTDQESYWAILDIRETFTIFVLQAYSSSYIHIDIIHRGSGQSTVQLHRDHFLYFPDTA